MLQWLIAITALEKIIIIKRQRIMILINIAEKTESGVMSLKNIEII